MSMARSVLFVFARMRRTRPDQRRLLRIEQQVLLARTRRHRIDGREDASVGQVAVELELHVARALELLEDDLVHLRARFHQGRSEDGQAAAAFDVSGSAQELLRRVQGRGIHAAGQDAPGCGLRQVVGARQAREAVEQHHNVLAVLHQAFRTLDDQLGNLDVVFGGHVEGGGDNLALDGALHVGDFLGALIDQKAHEVHLGVVGADGRGDVLQDGGLAGLRRADDQAALALADGADQVDDARRDGGLAMLHGQALVWIDRREVAEAHATAKLLDGLAVDGGHLLHGGVLLVGARRARGAGDLVALAQAVATDGGKPHVAILLAGQIAVGAQEAVTVLHDVEDALDLDEALGLQGRIVHGVDELGLLQARHVDVELGGLRAQLGHLELGQVLFVDARDDLAVVVALVTLVAVVAVVAVLATVAIAAVVALMTIRAGVAGVAALGALGAFAGFGLAAALMLLGAAFAVGALGTHRFARCARGACRAARGHVLGRVPAARNRLPRRESARLRRFLRLRRPAACRARPARAPP